MNSDQQGEKVFTPSLVVLLGMGAFGVMGGAMVAPGLPSLIEPFGVSDDAVGLVLSAYTFSAAISLPFIGLLIDRVGRKPVGIACLVLDGIMGIMCAFAPNFSVLVAFRFIQGMGIAGLIPVAMTVIGDWYEKRKTRLNVMGILSGTISASAVIIPLLGGLLAARSWRYPFFAYGFSLVLALLFYFLIDETKQKNHRNSDRFKEAVVQHVDSMRDAVAISRVRQTLLHSGVVYFLLYTMVTFMPLFLVTRHYLDEAVAGVALSLQAVFSVVLASKAGAVDEYLKWKGKLFLGFFFITAGLFLIPLWPTHLWVAVSLTLFGVGMGVVQPAIYHEATAAPPQKLTGSVVALFNTLKYVGMTAAPLILGMLRAQVSLDGLFYVAAGFGAVWIIFFHTAFGD